MNLINAVEAGSIVTSTLHNNILFFLSLLCLEQLEKNWEKKKKENKGK